MAAARVPSLGELLHRLVTARGHATPGKRSPSPPTRWSLGKAFPFRRVPRAEVSNIVQIGLQRRAIGDRKLIDQHEASGSNRYKKRMGFFRRTAQRVRNENRTKAPVIAAGIVASTHPLRLNPRPGRRLVLRGQNNLTRASRSLPIFINNSWAPMFSICSSIGGGRHYDKHGQIISIPLAELRQMMEAVARPGPRRDVFPFGISGMDEALPGGGLALGAVHEFCEDGARGGYAACALLFTAGILARLKGPVLWCLHSRDLFAPALARVGLHPEVRRRRPQGRASAAPLP